MLLIWDFIATFKNIHWEFPKRIFSLKLSNEHVSTFTHVPHNPWETGWGYDIIMSKWHGMGTTTGLLALEKFRKPGRWERKRCIDSNIKRLPFSLERCSTSPYPLQKIVIKRRNAGLVSNAWPRFFKMLLEIRCGAHTGDPSPWGWHRTSSSLKSVNDATAMMLIANSVGGPLGTCGCLSGFLVDVGRPILTQIGLIPGQGSWIV